MKAFHRFLLCSLFFLFFAWLLHLLVLGGIKKVRTEQFGVWNKIANGEVDADIIFTGSSRCWLHFSSPVIASITGKGCFNIGLDGSAPSLQKTRLDLFLQKNKGYKIIFQEVGITHLEIQKTIYNKKQYLPYLNEEILYDDLKKTDKEIYLYKYLPLYGIVQQNQFYIEESLKGWQQYATGHYRDTYQDGFYPMQLEWDGTADEFMEKNKEGKTFPIEQEAVQLLDQMIQEMKKKEVKVVLVFTPEYVGIRPFIKNREEIMAVYKNLADRNKIPFWNYSELPICYDKNNFYNSEHLKGSAAREFSKVFARDVKKYLTPLLPLTASSTR